MKHTVAITTLKKYTHRANIPTRAVVLLGLCAVVCYALGALTVVFISQQTPHPIIIEKSSNE